LEEEARFWEMHDLSLLAENAGTPLAALPLLEAEKKAVLAIRIQKSAKEMLKKIAKANGVNPTTLARLWLIEKIREHPRDSPR
jgi:tRNA G37 N-methylase Trm5